MGVVWVCVCVCGMWGCVFMCVVCVGAVILFTAREAIRYMRQSEGGKGGDGGGSWLGYHGSIQCFFNIDVRLFISSGLSPHLMGTVTHLWGGMGTW